MNVRLGLKNESEALTCDLTHFHFSLGKRAVPASSSDPASKPGQLGVGVGVPTFTNSLLMISLTDVQLDLLDKCRLFIQCFLLFDPEA